MSSRSQALPGKAWLTIICAAIVNLNLGALYAFSVWSNSLYRQKVLSPSLTQGAFLQFCVLFAFLVIWGGLLTDRIGPRITAMIGGAVYGLGLLVAGLTIQTSPALAMLLGFGTLASMGMGIAYSATVPAALKWTGSRWAGMVAGWVVFTYALQTLYMAPMIKFLVEKVSLGGSFIILGLFSGVFIIIAGIGLLRPPPGYAAPGPKIGPGKAYARMRDVGVGEALANPQLYLILFIFMIGAAVGLTFIANAYPVISKGPGALKSTFFTLVGVFGLINALSRPLVGFISDLTGRHWPLLILYGGAVLGSFLVIFISKAGVFWLAIPLMMCSYVLYGSLFSLFPAMIADNFGAKNLGLINGIIFFGGFGLGSIVVSLLRPAKDTLGLEGVFLILGILSLLGLGLIIFSMILERKRKPEIQMETGTRPTGFSPGGSCPACGTLNPAGVKFCSSCGRHLAEVPAREGVGPQIVPPAAGATYPVAYAGFWLRLVAWFIDACVVNIALLIVFVPLAVIIGVGAGKSSSNAILLLVYGIFYPVFIISIWLYSALLESSSKQATLGKMALGLVVTDLDGQRISFGKASGRHFGKIISSLILCIGFIMAGFTERKQALHDIMAGTLVNIKRK